MSSSLNPLANILSNDSDSLIGRKLVGIVVGNDDPTRKQCVQVAVPGLLETASIEDLPWYPPMRMSTASAGVGDNYGTISVPRIGSRVVVTLQDGDPSFGLYEADAISDLTALPEVLLTNYPNRVGHVNPKGDVLYTDLQTGEFAYTHHSGSEFKIADDGSVTFTVAKDYTQVVKGNHSLVVEGNSMVSTKGSASRIFQKGLTTSVSGGAMKTSVDGAHQLVATGKNTMSASGHTVSGTVRVVGDVLASGISLMSHSNPNGGPPA